MTTKRHNGNQTDREFSSVDCRVATHHGSNMCFLSLEIENRAATEITKHDLRFNGVEEAVQFLDRLPFETQNAKAELARCGNSESQLAEVGMPAEMQMEAGCDESGCFVIVYIYNDQEEAIRRDLTFPTKADVLRFLSKANEAVYVAMQMIEHAEQRTRICSEGDRPLETGQG